MADITSNRLLTSRHAKSVWIALQKVGSTFAGIVVVALVLTLLLRG